MARVDLADLEWVWLGWRPFHWMLRASMETGQALGTDLGPYPAMVPGTVQAALLAAGKLPDWRVGMSSLACEWVEHRHWELVTKLPACEARVVHLAAQGLDYHGWVLVDGRQVGQFSGVLKPFRMDLTAHLADGREHFLSLVFDQPPEEQGQIAFTSLSQHFKPRYNFSWDWCPRFVPTGVWGPLELLTDLEAEVELVKAMTHLDENLATGRVTAQMACRPAGQPANLRVRLRLLDGEREVAAVERPLLPGTTQVVLTAAGVEPWWPNGLGQPATYRLVVDVVDAADGSGQASWNRERRVGFKRIRWLPCEGAAPDALPWICEANGRTVFLQGVNWSPIRVAYPDTTVDEYRRRIGLYRDMGCNFLRVWGGAYLESEEFYDLCDEAGLLVWQEFPLSSSGIDNWPPERPEAIAELCRIATTYIHRRAHHVSLLMWCGGNELQSSGEGSKVGAGRPVSGDHPCLKALAEVVAAEDPERRFLPTSAYGPRFNAAAEEFGQGVHHLIHGPWGIGDQRSLEPWKEYWSGDDALFRAEVGMPGACDVELIQRYLPEAWWPPSNETWAHSSRWWLMWPRYSHIASLPPADALARYVELTQQEQAEALSFAARCCKSRFPRCGGFVIWHGHDCFPCPIGNALIDVEGNPKPVYFALQEVFKGG